MIQSPINFHKHSYRFLLENIILLVSLSFPSLLFAESDFCDKNKSNQVIYCNDFQSDDVGLYTQKKLEKGWPNLQSLSAIKKYSSLGISQKRVEVTEFVDSDNAKNKNAVLKIHYPKNKFGPWQTGATWNMQLSKLDQKKSYEHLSLEYKVMFKKGFLYNRPGLFGGKLPGLMGGKAIAGGATADGRNGWTSRIMWGQMGRGLGYLYYPDMKNDKYNQAACPRYGLDNELWVIKRNKYFSFDSDGTKKCLSEWAADDHEFRFGTGQFYKIKQQIEMNTLPEKTSGALADASFQTKLDAMLQGTLQATLQGNRDGELKIWLDEKLVLDCSNIRFRDVPELAIDSLIFSTFFGGNTPESSAHPHDEVIYFDDFIVKTEL